MEKEFFESFRKDDYQRDNFDRFIKAIRFSFNIPAIHIAGTNGKTSTANFIAGGYIRQGYKVGLFTSPYLYSPNEMIKINGQEISDDDFMDIYNKYKKEIKKYDLSAFEVEVFVALSHFQNSHCDLAVIECGMGGEIDATNIITPILTIITSISLEHTEFLGYTISEITAQKSGIFKENVPILVPELPEDAMTVIYETAKLNDAKINYLGHPVQEQLLDDGYSFVYGDFGTVKISSFAKYNIQNTVVALEAISLLREQFPFDTEKVVEGISKVQLPCEVEIVSRNPLVIIDGARNQEAMKKFCDVELLKIIKSRPIHVIFACCKDKNLSALLAVVGETTHDLTITTFDSPRARGEDEYFLFAEDYKFVADPIQLLNDKMQEFPDDCFFITGSLAFAALMRKQFIK